MNRAAELAANICINGASPRAAILSVLIAYGEEVRAKAAGIAESRAEERHGWDKHGDAEAIEKMELP